MKKINLQNFAITYLLCISGSSPASPVLGISKFSRQFIFASGILQKYTVYFSD